MTTDKKIIVALDYENLSAARNFIQAIDPSLCHLKVGHIMFTRFGVAWVEELIRANFSVFLDLKFFDIPNTVAKAVRMSADLGVWMLTLHAMGGRTMLRAAHEILSGILGQKPLLLAVTVLTSWQQQDLSDVNIQTLLSDQVVDMARLAMDSGMDGVVCSPQEISLLREKVMPRGLLVTPGIRMKHESTHDQKRVATPEEALYLGSDYLVIGRSITEAEDPVRRLQELQAIRSRMDPG